MIIGFRIITPFSAEFYNNNTKKERGKEASVLISNIVRDGINYMQDAEKDNRELTNEDFNKFCLSSMEAFKVATIQMRLDECNKFYLNYMEMLIILNASYEITSHTKFCRSLSYLIEIMKICYE